MKAQRGNRMHRMGFARPQVEGLEDRYVLNGLSLLSGSLLVSPSSTSSSSSGSLTSILTNTSGLLSTPFTGGSNTGTPVSSLLSNALNPVSLPGTTPSTGVTGVTPNLTNLTSIVGNLSGLTGSVGNVGGLSGLVSALTSSASNLTGLVATVTSLTGSITAGAGGLTLPVNLNVGLNGLSLNGTSIPLLGGLNLSGLTNGLLGGLNNGLLGGVLSTLTGLTVNLNLGLNLGQGLQLQVGVNVQTGNAGLLNLGIVGNLLNGSLVNLGVQAQVPGGTTVSGSVGVTPPTTGLPSTPIVLPTLPIPPDQLPVPPVLRIDNRTVSGGGSGGGSTEVFAGGPAAPNDPKHPGDLRAPTAEAVARTQPLTPTSLTSVTLPIQPNLVGGPEVRGLFGGEPEGLQDPLLAAGVALVVPGGGGDGARAEGPAAEGARGADVVPAAEPTGLDVASDVNASPQAATVLAECSPFDLTAAQAALSRFLDQVSGMASDAHTFAGNAGLYPWMVAAVAAAGALEVRRRRKRRTPESLPAALGGEEAAVPWLVEVEGSLPCVPK